MSPRGKHEYFSHYRREWWHKENVILWFDSTVSFGPAPNVLLASRGGASPAAVLASLGLLRRPWNEIRLCAAALGQTRRALLSVLALGTATLSPGRHARLDSGARCTSVGGQRRKAGSIQEPPPPPTTKPAGRLAGVKWNEPLRSSVPARGHSSRRGKDRARDSQRSRGGP